MTSPDLNPALADPSHTTTPLPGPVLARDLKGHHRPMRTTLNKELDPPSCPLGSPLHFSDRNAQRADSGSNQKSNGQSHRRQKVERWLPRTRGTCLTLLSHTVLKMVKMINFMLCDFF